GTRRPADGKQRVRADPGTEQPSLSRPVQGRQSRSVAYVDRKLATASEWTSGHGASRVSATASKPITAGLMPRSTARVHVYVRTRSNAGRIASIMTNDGRKAAPAATAAPATPATL